MLIFPLGLWWRALVKFVEVPIKSAGRSSTNHYKFDPYNPCGETSNTCKYEVFGFKKYQLVCNFGIVERILFGFFYVFLVLVCFTLLKLCLSFSSIFLLWNNVFFIKYFVLPYSIDVVSTLSYMRYQVWRRNKVKFGMHAWQLSSKLRMMWNNERLWPLMWNITSAWMFIEQFIIMLFLYPFWLQCNFPIWSFCLIKPHPTGSPNFFIFQLTNTAISHKLSLRDCTHSCMNHTSNYMYHISGENFTLYILMQNDLLTFQPSLIVKENINSILCFCHWSIGIVYLFPIDNIININIHRAAQHLSPCSPLLLQAIPLVSAIILRPAHAM